MGKYDPLGTWLRRRTAPEIDLKFTDIERILGALLPKAAADPAWWTGEARNSHVQTAVWRAAGFEARPDIRSEQVRFVRTPARDPDQAVDAPFVDEDGTIWLPAPQMDRVALFNGGASRVRWPVQLFKVDPAAVR